MRIVQYVVIALVVILLAVAVAAPIGPLPGFFIGGESTAAPAQWQDTSAVDEIHLRVPGTPPRVVILWVVDVAGELYILGAPDSGWVTQLGDGGPVDMRLEEATYPLRAERMQDGWQPVFAAYIAKYEPGYPEIIATMPPADQAQGLITVYKLNRT